MWTHRPMCGSQHSLHRLPPSCSQSNLASISSTCVPLFLSNMSWWVSSASSFWTKTRCRFVMHILLNWESFRPPNELSLWRVCHATVRGVNLASNYQAQTFWNGFKPWDVCYSKTKPPTVKRLQEVNSFLIFVRWANFTGISQLGQVAQ